MTRLDGSSLDRSRRPASRLLRPPVLPAGAGRDGDRASIDYADRAGSRGVGNDLPHGLPAPVFPVRRNSGRAMPGRNGTRRDSAQAGRWWATRRPGSSTPPFWVAVLIGHPAALGWLTVGSSALGGTGSLRAAPGRRAGRWAAVFAGGCYEAAPYLIGHTFEGHYPHVWSASWYPWAFSALVLSLRARGPRSLDAASDPGIAFLTGHPQEWYLLVLALAVWLMAEVWKGYRFGQVRGTAGRALRAWVGLMAVSLGFCGRVHPGGRPPLAARPGRDTSGEMNRYFVHSVNLLQLLDPFALGRPSDYRGHDNYWESVVSIGLAPLVLAFIGLYRYRDRSVAKELGWLVLVSLVFAGGRRLGLYSLAYAVLPGMDRFRVPSRSLFLASLGGSLLAGAGLNELLLGGLKEQEWDALRTKLGRVLCGLACLVAVIGLVLTGPALILVITPRRTPTEWPLVACGTRSSRGEHDPAGSSRQSRPRAGAHVLVQRAGNDRVRHGGGGEEAWSGDGRAGARGDRARGGLGLRGGSAGLRARLGVLRGRACRTGSRARVGTSFRPKRVASVGMLLPDLAAAASGLEKSNVNDSFQIGHAAALYETLYPFLEPARRRLKPEQPMDLAVEREAALARRDRPDERRPPGLRSRRVGARPRTRARRFPRGVRRSEDLEESDPPAPGLHRAAGRSGRRRPGPDPPRPDDRKPSRASLDGSRPSGTDASAALHAGRLAKPRAGRGRACVETQAPGLLVVANTWMPGWTATVDGAPARVYRGNHCQQVVAIRSGGSARGRDMALHPPGLGAASPSHRGRSLSGRGLAWPGSSDRCANPPRTVPVRTSSHPRANARPLQA